MPNTKIGKFSVEPIASRYDSRVGLGYGLSQARFHKPRSASSQFPYIVDELEDELDASEFEDPGSDDAIAIKTLDLYVNDPLAHKSADPFYFAGGNTKLSDCFFRIDAVLEEVAALGDSMSPIPTRRPTAAVAGSGAAFPSGVGRRPRTGSGRGYASAPPMSKIEAQMDYEEESEEENYSLKDFAIDDDNLG